MDNETLMRRIISIEERLAFLEVQLEKKRREDNDILYNLDEGNFTEAFLKKILGG